jgi:HEPN domain-containing protein
LSPEHREVAELMVSKARNDLRSAEALVATADFAEDVVGFLLQQTIEKSLKAVIAGREREVPRTHDLEELVQLVEDSEQAMPEIVASSAWLTPWAVDFRYEEPQSPLDTEAALTAAKIALLTAERALIEDEAPASQ